MTQRFIRTLGLTLAGCSTEAFVRLRRPRVPVPPGPLPSSAPRPPRRATTILIGATSAQRHPPPARRSAVRPQPPARSGGAQQGRGGGAEPPRGRLPRGVLAPRRRAGAAGRVRAWAGVCACVSVQGGAVQQAAPRRLVPSGSWGVERRRAQEGDEHPQGRGSVCLSGLGAGEREALRYRRSTCGSASLLLALFFCLLLCGFFFFFFFNPP